jgi:hypothetical protein
MVTLLATVQGNKPQEQTEYLSLSCNGKTRQIAAYNKGSGFIKLFLLQDYINYCYFDKKDNSVGISPDLYNDNKALGNFIKETFFVKQSIF